MINVVLVLAILILSFIAVRLFPQIVISIALAACGLLGLSIFIFKKITREETREDDPVFCGKKEANRIRKSNKKEDKKIKEIINRKENREELYKIYKHSHRYNFQKNELNEKNPYLLYVYNKINGAWEDLVGDLFFKLSEYGESACFTNKKAKDFTDDVIDWYTSKMRDDLIECLECSPIKPEICVKSPLNERGRKRKYTVYAPYRFPFIPCNNNDP